MLSKSSCTIGFTYFIFVNVLHSNSDFWFPMFPLGICFSKNGQCTSILCTNLCATGVMMKDENCVQKRWKTRSPHKIVLPFFIPTPSAIHRDLILLWVTYHPVAQTEAYGWLRGPYNEPLVKRSNQLGNRTFRGPVGYSSVNTLFGWAKHSEHPLHPSPPHMSVNTFVGIVCRPWLVWNQSFTHSTRLITKDRSTRWRAPSIRFHPRTLVRTPREGRA